MSFDKNTGKILKKTFPLIAFSFTILLTIFLIHGLFNQKNVNVLFQVVGLKFYREGIFYALHIGLNILNMLLSFAVFVLSTKPSEFVDELEKRGFSPRFGYIVTSVFQIIPQMMGTMNTIMDAQRSRGLETEGISGELIELSAEGARREPNLSGKRTEPQLQQL